MGLAGTRDAVLCWETGKVLSSREKHSHQYLTPVPLTSFPNPVRSLFSPQENTHAIFLFHVAIAYSNAILQGQQIGTFRSFAENYCYSTQLNPDFAIDSFLTEPLSTFPQHIYFPYTGSESLCTVFQMLTQGS